LDGHRGGGREEEKRGEGKGGERRGKRKEEMKKRL
jgi:hypothetical protein